MPSFLPGDASHVQPHNEQVLKERFRKFWMVSVADAFKDDLEEIRKEPNLDASRLSMLVDSLASGADAFTSRADESDTINEMEVALGHLP